jgi:hypothetical protein
LVPGTALCFFALVNEFIADCYVVSNRDGHQILAQNNPAGVMFSGSINEIDAGLIAAEIADMRIHSEFGFG